MGQTRGRRRDKKNKKEALAEESWDGKDVENNISEDFVPLDGDVADAPQAEQAAFYGLLDRQELEYFKSAESTLAANAFTGDEKDDFVNNLFEETKGKELKLVTTQVCSKLVERLIDAANREQLIQLLKAFGGHVYRLSLQKYSSHCVEALFYKAAGSVDDEILHRGASTDGDAGEVVTVEQLLLYLINELHANLKDMVHEKYASHVLRLVLLIVSGLPLGPDPALRSKKSVLARKYTEIETAAIHERQVPESFTVACSELMAVLTKGMDGQEARRMAIDPVTSPVLQIIIRIQAAKSNFTVVDLCLGGESADAFFEHLLSDPVGSHFLEQTLSVLPKKKIRDIYKSHFAGRVAKLARRDTGNYVVRALLRSTSVPKRELVAELVPEVQSVLKENRAGVIAEALRAADATQRAELEKEILEHFGGLQALVAASKTDSSRQALLSVLVNEKRVLDDAAKVLAGESADELKKAATDPVQSRFLETILVPEVDIVERRKLINLFVPLACELACNSNGSHIVDKLWRFCHKLKFGRERIADNLSKEEEKLKHSIYGRAVWKNWHLDKYLRKRHEWWNAVKASEDEISGPEEVAKKHKPGPGPKFSPKANLKGTRPVSANREKPYDRPVRG